MRTLLLAGSMFLFFFLFFNTILTMTLVLVGALIIFQIVSLFYYLDRTTRVLNNFLESIRYSDFTRTFQIENSDSSFNKLKQAFNQVIKEFQEVRAEKDEHYFYLQTIIQHIGIGLIAFQKDGKVELINNATKKLFQLRNLSNIQSLKEVSPELVNQLLTIKHGENVLVKIRDKDGFLQLSVYATQFTINTRPIMLVSIKNIQHELDEKEMESWQKLIQVLTHEIMNSIAPISSLSSSLPLILNQVSDRLVDKMVDPIVVEDIKEVEQALTTIHKRTDGLIHFVNTYRSLTKVPEPIFGNFLIVDLFNNIVGLHGNDAASLGVKTEIIVEPQTLELSADEKLIEQVLINLYKNAMQALNGRPNSHIQFKAFINNRSRITIQVIDNGPGILPQVIDKIFIPFFSTKQQGSGIGLSLSRQILRMHNGTLHAYSEPEQETKFTLTF